MKYIQLLSGENPFFEKTVFFFFGKLLYFSIKKKERHVCRKFIDNFCLIFFRHECLKRKFEDNFFVVFEKEKKKRLKQDKK